MSDEMKRELNALRAEMHKGMGEFRDELRKGRSESRQEMVEIRAIFRRTMIHVARMTGDIADIKHDLATSVATKDDISMLYNRMDNFSGSQKDADFNSAKNLHRLDDHGKRLDKLEARRAQAP